MKCDDVALRLYAVTDRAWTGKQTLPEQVEAALQGGITMLQLREKALSQEAFLAEALEMQALCRRYQVPFLINDDVALAIRCNADGVHVGQHDMAAQNVRQLLGADKLLGVSVQTVEQAVLAEQSGADYLGVGAVFPTSTKTDADAVSIETLRAICDAVSLPVCAIGGITADNLQKLSGTGIEGVALVSAIFAAEDITGQCKQLRQQCELLFGEGANA